MPLRIGFAYNQKPTEDDEPPSRTSHDRYAEWDDASTIDAVAAALNRAGTVLRLEADLHFPERLREADPDIVFNIAEGLNGPNREAHVPAICEFFGVPYTGSDPLTLTLGLDKNRTKEVLRVRGVPTPAWTVLENTVRPPGFDSLRYPVMVKPLHEGSSKGIDCASFCPSPSEALMRVGEVHRSYQQPVLVEEFLPGREFTCAILGNGCEARALPLVEIRFDALPPGAPAIYGWEAKWVWDRPEAPLEIFDCPAQVEPELERALRKAALEAFHALGCRDWCRIDLRLDGDGTPHIMEINPLPGILPDPKQNSCFPKAARAAGLEYDELILAVLDTALERWGLRR